MTRLIVFDVEGVILPRKRALILEIARLLGWSKTFKILFLAVMFQLKLVSLSRFLRNSYKLLKGSSIEDFFGVYRSLPVVRNGDNAFRRLKEHGFTTVLMSSGLPQEILEDLKSKLGADRAHGVDVYLDKYGMLTGEIGGETIEDEGKLKILRRIVIDLGVEPVDVVVVADDWNNLQMLGDCGLLIGFNPEVEVAAKTGCIIQGNDLMPVVDRSLGLPIKEEKKLSKEVFIRKALHMLGALTLLLSVFFGIFVTQLLIVLTLILYISSEYLRLSGGSLPLFTLFTRSASSEVEQMRIVFDPVWYALGILLSISLFPFRFAMIGVLTLTIGDPIASMVGRSIRNRHPYSFNRSKSIEGTLAGFSAAMLACAVFANPFISIIGCLIGMLVEALPLPISDNITVPILSSLLSLASSLI